LPVCVIAVNVACVLDVKSAMGSCSVLVWPPLSLVNWPLIAK